jgi:hypothetical protein
VIKSAKIAAKRRCSTAGNEKPAWSRRAMVNEFSLQFDLIE